MPSSRRPAAFASEKSAKREDDEVVRFVGISWCEAPLFPGTDLAVSSSAELCAIDVRTGAMLGCSRGRTEAMDRLLFLWQAERAGERLVERTLRSAVAAAAGDLRARLAAR